MTKWLVRHSWRLALVAGLGGLLALAAACGGDDDNASTTPTKTAGTSATATGTPAATGNGGALKIGALLSFTGDLGSFGQPIYNGAELAVDEINANGGVNGQPITLVKGDDATTPQVGVTEAQRLVNVEHVSAIIGALSSGVSLQVAETVTGPGKVLQISPASTSPGLTDANDNDFLFRTTISDAAQGLVLANLAKDENLSTVCDLYVNNAYGKGLSASFRAAFEALGGTVTKEVPHEQSQTTYATELAECAGADALAAIAYPQSATTFLREAVEGNMFQHYLFTDGTKEPDMFSTLTYAAFDGQRGTSPASLPTASATTFVAAYQAKYGELPPKPYIREAYDAVYLIALAAEKAHSNDGTAIRDALRDVANAPGIDIAPGPAGWTAAVTAIAAGQDINYEGTASLEYDAKGDPLVGAIQWWHVDAATSKLVTDKTFKVDLTTKTVTDISSQVTP
jgi:ABC-type branched-subunit amino acid transport system substrate-binding protein